MTNDAAEIARLIEEIDHYTADLRGPGIEEVRQGILHPAEQRTRQGVSSLGAIQYEVDDVAVSLHLQLVRDGRRRL